MVKFQSPDIARDKIDQIQFEIKSLIEGDLLEANCPIICLDNWMDRFSKKKEMQNKYHRLCALEMALIDAQLFLEHQKV